jgi:hypothetical protein
MNDVYTSSVSRPTRLRHDKSDDNSSSRSSFLEVLRKLLDESGQDGHGIMSWNADGLSFCINDSQRFIHYLIPVYFGNGNSCCTTGHHQNPQQEDEPLQTFDAFLERLRLYGFLYIFDDRIGNYIHIHPLFVRDTTYSTFQATSNEPKFFVRQQNSMPMTALNRGDFCTTPSIPLRSKKEHRSRPFRTGVSKRGRPIRASASNHKIKRNHRRRVDPFPNHRIDDRRKPSARSSQHAPHLSESSQASFHELLRDVSFYDNENENVNSTSDDYEPLCVSTTCNTLIDEIELAGIVLEIASPTRPNEYISPSDPVIDVEPLDPIRHDEDDTLHEDIAKALSRI